MEKENIIKEKEIKEEEVKINNSFLNKRIMHLEQSALNRNGFSDEELKEYNALIKAYEVRMKIEVDKAKIEVDKETTREKGFFDLGNGALDLLGSILLYKGKMNVLRRITTFEDEGNIITSKAFKEL